jgi:hypothetical protein
MLGMNFISPENYTVRLATFLAFLCLQLMIKYTLEQLFQGDTPSVIYL